MGKAEHGSAPSGARHSHKAVNAGAEVSSEEMKPRPPPVDTRQIHRSWDTELHRLGPGHLKEAHLTRLLQIYEQSVVHRAEASIWDDNLWQMVQMTPRPGTLWISRCEGATRVNPYRQNNMYVKVLWNKKVVGQTTLAASADNPVWDEGFEMPRIFTREEIVNTLVLQLWHRHLSVLEQKDKRGRDDQSGETAESSAHPPVLISELVLKGRGVSALPRGEVTLPLPGVDFGDGCKAPRKSKPGSITISFQLQAPPRPTEGVTPRRAARARARAKAVELATTTGKIEALNELRSRRLDLSFCEIAGCQSDIATVTKKYAIPEWTSPGELTEENNPRPPDFHLQVGTVRP